MGIVISENDIISIKHEALNRNGFALGAGLGKTTLANILANELNVGIKVSSGPSIYIKAMERYICEW